ncbi:tetratricopeptide repeat-containing sensor histidine kinase [Winogradskyella pulchriflava]|uniref:histidine kinase n=1 Tax=Winogradskyella pulchriflava TaxID=1110688 RepID=A0ABV6Q8P1_9FLAO
MKYYYFVILLCFSCAITSQNNVDKSQKLIDSLLNSVDTVEDYYEKIKVLTSNAGRMRYTPITRPLIDKAVQISQLQNNDKLLANSYYSLGNYFFFNSKIDSAEIYIDKSLSYVNDETMPFLRATNLMTKSGITRKKGNIPQALAIMLRAKEAMDKIDTLTLEAEQIRKYKGESLVLNNALANYYNQMEEVDKAIEYYDGAYKSALSLDSKVNAGIILSNKGELLLDQGKNTEALELFKEGKKLKEEGKAPSRFIMSSYLNIGNAQTKLQQYDAAAINLNKAHQHYIENGPEENIIISKNYLGSLFIATEQFNDAVTECEAAKTLALKSGNLELIADASNCLSEAYKAVGKYDKALENYKLLTKTNDSIFNENNIKKQTQQEMQYEFNKTQELNALELEAKEKQSKLYSYLAGLGLLLAMVLGFFFYRNRKQNIKLAKQQKLLKATIDEKNVLLKETHHRVKNSFQIVSSLLYLQSESVVDKEAKIAIKEAENRVRSMVLIHQKLYNKDELVGINAKEYFSDLVRDIFESHQFKSEPIPYSIEAESLVLDIETITPVGLILNELIVNTLKHAFDKVTSKSKIDIKFNKVGENLELKVIDNGKGFEGEIKSTSFGITLMKALSKKLNASLNYTSELHEGTEAKLVMRKFNVL